MSLCFTLICPNDLKEPKKKRTTRTVFFVRQISYCMQLFPIPKTVEKRGANRRQKIE
jgi:hypothetical protein